MSTPATYADLLALDEGLRAEVLGGVVHTQPAPLPRHSKAQGSLRRFVGGPFDDDDGAGGPGGWWILLEVDVELEPHEVVRPDLAGWRRDRLPRPGDARPITARPDWVCEVLSPSTAGRDRVTKSRLYAKHRVPHYWLVDPVARTLEALELRDEQWVVLASLDDRSPPARIAAFDAIELDVARLFLPRDVDPPPLD
ncbi:MAG: Uma2 family endonuclease [Sandaracinaceae bacterium]